MFGPLSIESIRLLFPIHEYSQESPGTAGQNSTGLFPPQKEERALQVTLTYSINLINLNLNILPRDSLR